MNTAEREALADLLGAATLPAVMCSVRVDQLDSALVEAVGTTARLVVEELVGPVYNRPDSSSPARRRC
ncbi:TIGR02679 domain-containing protein [Nocardia jiangxiensis]|uniref:TIGR02679 domain-containing protein n=1 Tax=Nocardia jiangxiensis TaxID=282685 RepID=A0ABW6S9I3_9NOCA